jgi:hypothetical protein
MARLILLLAVLEIGGSWLLESRFGLPPPLAYGVMVIVLAIFVATFILLKAWPPLD